MAALDAGVSVLPPDALAGALRDLAGVVPDPAVALAGLPPLLRTSLLRSPRR